MPGLAGPVLVLRALDGDALGDGRVVLVVAAVVHGAAGLGVGGAGLGAVRGLLELVGARVEVDAADGVGGDELGDVVELALEGAVAELEGLLDVALAGGLVEELGLLALGRAREV